MSGLEGSYISGVAGSPVDIGRLEVELSNIAKPMLEEVLQRVEFYLGHTVCGGAKTSSSPVF